MIVIGDNMEDLFIEIENIIAGVSTFEELKDKKREYIKQHRLVLLYFNDIQKELEEGEYDSSGTRNNSNT